MREPFETIRSPVLVLPQANIDTDQIIPARFLKTVSRDGVGAHLFADWRERGDTPLDDPRARGCAVLVAGDNFGCGSSREHAAWAIADFGIRAVISTTIADIFRSNALKNGILPIEVSASVHRELAAAPWREVEVDLKARCVRFDGHEEPFAIDSFSAECLERGLDELDWLIERLDSIERFEEARA